VRRLPADEATIAGLDADVGALLDSLEASGRLRNTLIVVASDHGEEFGEHGLFGHGNSLYRPALRVPLLVRFPSRAPQGIRLAAPVTLRDIPATVADLLGVDGWPEEAGASLARHWSGNGTTAPDAVLSEVRFARNLPPQFPVSKGNMKSIVMNNWHYIRNGDGKEELYDLTRDVDEQVDLTASHSALLEQMRTRLARLIS